MKRERLEALYAKTETDSDLKEALDEVVKLHTALEFVAAWTAGAAINGSAEAMAKAIDMALGKIREVNTGWRRPEVYGT